jgi:hypothetical protein
VARPQGVEGLGMVGPNETLGSLWPPLAIRLRFSSLRIRRLGGEDTEDRHHLHFVSRSCFISSHLFCACDSSLGLELVLSVGFISVRCGVSEGVEDGRRSATQWVGYCRNSKAISEVAHPQGVEG